MLHKNFFLAVVFLVLVLCSCSADSEDVLPNVNEPEVIETPETTYADINFSNWKVTLPVDEDNNGSPDEYKPAQLINGKYRTLKPVKPYMYDDTTDASIVFYTFPAQTTANSKYSRTELRELIDPATSRVNWSLETGGTIKGKLKMMEISKDNNNSSRTFHRTIVMQIHGIISLADMAKFGFSSNNGPPLIKMTWIDGDLWVYKKSLKDEATSGDDLLDVSSNTWADIKHNMGTVNFDPFEFRITASKGKIELQLNNNTPYIIEDVSLAKWPFENYFKAGNYLGTTDEGAYAKLKYYNLTVTH